MRMGVYWGSLPQGALARTRESSCEFGRGRKREGRWGGEGPKNGKSHRLPLLGMAVHEATRGRRGRRKAPLRRAFYETKGEVALSSGHLRGVVTPGAPVSCEAPES